MIAQTYCGGKYYAGTEEFACGQRDEPCRKCLKRHIARLEAALVEADEERIGAEELAALREVVRLVADARERYDKHPRGAGGQRMPDEIDDLLCRLYEIGAHPALRAQATEGSA